MKPTDKSPEFEQFLSNMFGFNRADTIKANKCVPSPIGCGQSAGEFRDNLSRKEYAISGLCQPCQDSIFGAENEQE